MIADPLRELKRLHDELAPMAALADSDEVCQPRHRVTAAVDEIARSWGGSWLPALASFYYRDFQPPPFGVCLLEGDGSRADDPTGAWRAHSPDEVRGAILERAGRPDLGPLRALGARAGALLPVTRDAVVAQLERIEGEQRDPFVREKASAIARGRLKTVDEVLRDQAWYDTRPGGDRDTGAWFDALGRPPHLVLQAEVREMDDAGSQVRWLAGEVASVITHVEKMERKREQSARAERRVHLVPVDAALERAFARSPGELEARAGGRLGDAEAAVRDVLASTLAMPHRTDEWGGYLAVDDGAIVGTCTFTGPPDGDGAVEIAYLTFPPFEGRGYATLMARRLLAIAAACPLVVRVVAHTRPEANGSTRVLERIGMGRVGDARDDDIGAAWRWECRIPR